VLSFAVVCSASRKAHRAGVPFKRKTATVQSSYIGETGFSWHTFHFLIFYSFRRNDTGKKMVLVARVILRLRKKIY
jgi:hypothetical protein